VREDSKFRRGWEDAENVYQEENHLLAILQCRS